MPRVAVLLVLGFAAGVVWAERDGRVPAASLLIISNGTAAYPVSTTTAPSLSIDGDIFTIRTISFSPGDRGTGTPIQTHEVAFDPASDSAFVSLLTTGQLFRLSFDPTGALRPSVARYTFNSPDSGLHNVAMSGCHPGALWVSTQYENAVHLVKPGSAETDWEVLFSLTVPRFLHNGTAWINRLSEPHAIREQADCSIWVALKGNTRGLPAGVDDIDYTEIYDAMAVLNRSLPQVNHSDGHAVWHVDPEKYDPAVFPGLGGSLHPAMPTPVMSAVDGQGYTFHAQDCSPYLLRVDPDGKATQVPVGIWFKASGPGVVAAPDGSVWVCSLTKDDGLLLRFRPGTIVPEPFVQLTALGAPASASASAAGAGAGRVRRTIHLAFDTHLLNGTQTNVMYVLTSSLLLPSSTAVREEVFGFTFDATWDVLLRKTPIYQIPLPVFNSATHRIAVGSVNGRRSLLVTGLLADVVYQIMPNATQAVLW